MVFSDEIYFFPLVVILVNFWSETLHLVCFL